MTDEDYDTVPWVDEHGREFDHTAPGDQERPSARRAEVEQETPDVFKKGGGFVLDVPAIPTAIWGDGDQVIWSEGEALMIAAPQGVGKTTIALQVVRARLGLQDKVLDHSVQFSAGRVLYLAMDRPAQMRRAAHRLFTEDDRVILDSHLVVWDGPPPYDVAVRRDILAVMASKARADTIIVDSVKDAAIGLSKDEVGAGYNRARQQALAEGFQILELHHMRKASAENKQPDSIDDIYGSTWLTSGCGSVVLLWGEPGDPVVSWRHLKQPAGDVGPFRVIHDHLAGTSSRDMGVDLIALVRSTGQQGLSPRAYAEAIHETSKPTRGQVERARRLLKKAVTSESLFEQTGERGGTADTGSSTYFLRYQQ